MSNLHFFYGPMSASKSAKLITDRYNFEKKGTKVLVLKPRKDRTTRPEIYSRLGIKCPAVVCDNLELEYLKNIKCLEHDVIMLDEVQFFTKKDIDNLVILADKYNKLVFCFGLLEDVNENLFEGSKRLIEVGAKLHELPASCEIEGCMNLATHHLRYRKDGTLIKNGESIAIDDGIAIFYKSVCRMCYNKLLER